MNNILFSLIVVGLMVLSSCATTQETATTTTTRTTTQRNANVKVINGKRYVFVRAELNSNIPGRWVPEGSPAAQTARQTGTLDSSVFTNTQSAPGAGLPQGGGKIPGLGGQ